MDYATYRQQAALIYILANYLNFYEINNLTENLIVEKIDLETAMQYLSEIERKVVFHIFVRGETFEKTAKKIDRSVGFTHYTAKRALKKLVDYCLPS